MKRIVEKIFTAVVRILFSPITFPLVCIIVRLVDGKWDIKNIFRRMFLQIKGGQNYGGV